MAARPVSVRLGASDPDFRARLQVGAHAAVADEPAELGGGDLGPAPDEVLLSALGACTAITLRMYAARKQWPLEDVQVELAYGERDKAHTVIERRVRLGGPLDDQQRQRLLQIANACPVHRILTGTVEVPTTLAG